MFQRILLALDAGTAGCVATSFTVALARQCQATVHVVHVNEYLAGGRGLTSESSAMAANLVADALRDMHAGGVSATGVTYRTTIFDIPAAICDLADQVRADVIVVGSRRRRRPWFVRNGIRDRVARKTPLPVITAPAPLRVDKRARTLQELPPIDISIRS